MLGTQPLPRAGLLLRTMGPGAGCSKLQHPPTGRSRGGCSLEWRTSNTRRAEDAVPVICICFRQVGHSAGPRQPATLSTRVWRQLGQPQ